jgi:hypothetical protein
MVTSIRWLAAIPRAVGHGRTAGTQLGARRIVRKAAFFLNRVLFLDSFSLDAGGVPTSRSGDNHQ